MGFFDRLAKSLRGKKDADDAWPVEGNVYVSHTPLAQRPTIAGTPLPGNGQLGETSLSGIAVAELPPPSTIESSEEHEPSSSEAPGEAFFGEDFDVDFDQDLDAAFASLVSNEAAPQAERNGEEMVPTDQLVVEHLFADIAANYARPVKNFVFELKRGTATKEWIDICRPAMHGITRAAEGMGLSEAAQRMIDFEAALTLAQGSEQRVLNGEIRDLLLLCYADLTKVMPNAFLVGEEEQAREGIIINSLLMQIPDLGRVTVEKLYRAGLTSLDTLFLAKSDELAAATGIPFFLSERICEKFQAYRSELEGQSRDVADTGQRARLAEMLAELRRLHDGFQRAFENEWSDPAFAVEKREYRQLRQSCFLQVNVALAEMGELDLLNELQKFSFERRISRLEEFLATPPASL